MTPPIPLIRAASLAPAVKWLERRGRAGDAALLRAGATCDPLAEPERLISLRAAVTLLCNVAEAEGLPDLGWRVISETSVGDLGRLGMLILSERTPAEALHRTSAAMAHFCSHETLDLVEGPDGGTVTSRFLLNLDPAMLHQAQLQTLALVRSLCALTGRPEHGLFEAIRMPPHPGAGLTHLPPAIAALATPSGDASMTITISRAVLHSPLRPGALLAQTAGNGEPWEQLRGSEAGFTQVIRNLIGDALPDGQPSAERMANNAGVTLRTLQRRLKAEGTSFRALLEDARRSLALNRIGAGPETLGEISAALGYSDPATLSRAVRRWTDRSPQALRQALRTP